MPSRQKESLYKDRIFGDDDTPPRPIPARPENNTSEPLWFTNKTCTMATANQLSNDPTVYHFNRDALSSARLNLQHQLFISSTNFHLHPHIPLRRDQLAADIGCGTGIWSLETAKTLPSDSKIEAFDLSLAQTPPKQWWPKNVSFKQLDIFEPLPAELIGRYDIVNIRLFMCVISSGDPMHLLRQLFKLLKPGGHLQWQEYDSSTDKIVVANPSTAAPKLQALISSLRASSKNLSSWTSNLQDRFAEAGGELVRLERHWTSKESIIIKQDISFLAVREYVANLRSKGGRSEVADGIERLVTEAEEECWALGRGAFVDSEMVTWVVRKL